MIATGIEENRDNEREFKNSAVAIAETIQNGRGTINFVIM